MDFDRLGSSGPHRHHGADVSAFRNYVEDYYANLFSYVEQREKRRQELVDRLEDQRASRETAAECWKEWCSRETMLLRMQRLKLTKEHFDFIDYIGQGSFAKVYLVRRKDTEELFALKVIKKSTVTARNAARIRTERAILISARSRWLVRLCYAFQDLDALYMAMEFMPGGTLGSLLDMFGCFDEESARFYFAETLACVQALHGLGYIHRDLKPDNLFIGADGHVKLGDFGLSSGPETMAATTDISTTANLTASQRRSLFAKSIVGTALYMAPELLAGRYRESVDYWALGCILHEMLLGVAPLGDSEFSDTQILRELASGAMAVGPRPAHISPEAWDLVSGLLRFDATDRYSADDVTHHEWLHGFRVHDVVSMDPPFIPQLDSPTDLFYFRQTSEASGGSCVQTPPNLTESPSDGIEMSFQYPYKTPHPHASAQGSEQPETVLVHRERSIFGTPPHAISRSDSFSDVDLADLIHSAPPAQQEHQEQLESDLRTHKRRLASESAFLGFTFDPASGKGSSIRSYLEGFEDSPNKGY